jgi:nucleotide-binding universal stress UspA family protein
MTEPTATISFKKIVVATDFEACSQRAVDTAASLSRIAGGELIVVHAYDVPAFAYAGLESMTIDWLTPIQNAAQQSLDDCVRQLRERDVKARGVLAPGPAWEHILNVAKQQNADLIVIGTHGRRGVAHAILGSVAEKVVHLSTLPVLTIRGAEKLG